jgi:hypothetical protein
LTRSVKENLLAEDRIAVTYNRKVSQPTGNGKYETLTLGGSLEFDVPDGQQWQEAYEGAYITYKMIVDQLLDEALPEAVVEKEERVQTQQRTLPGESISPKAPSEQVEGDNFPPAPNKRAEFTGCKVFKIEEATTRTNKKWAKIRIGLGDGYSGEFTTAKSFEPPMVSKLLGLREGDIINIKGYWTPWQTDETKFDLVAQSLDLRR